MTRNLLSYDAQTLRLETSSDKILAKLINVGIAAAPLTEMSIKTLKIKKFPAWKLMKLTGEVNSGHKFFFKVKPVLQGGVGVGGCVCVKISEFDHSFPS